MGARVLLSVHKLWRPYSQHNTKKVGADLNRKVRADDKERRLLQAPCWAFPGIDRVSNGDGLHLCCLTNPSPSG